MAESRSEHSAQSDASARAVALARTYHLDEAHLYGCAETSYMVLKAAYGLDDSVDPAAAMALNGGVAWSGGLCGAITGAALAVGLLAEKRIADHSVAKRVAREIIADTLAAFREEFGAVDCRDLIGYDLRAPGGHHAFLESGLWNTRCISQIETVVGHLAGLADADAWDEAARHIEAPPAH